MDSYRITPGVMSSGTGFSITSVRYTIGLAFTSVRALYLEQSARQQAVSVDAY